MTLTYDTNIVSEEQFNRLPRETQIAIEVYHPPRPATLPNIGTPELLEIIINAASTVGFKKENFTPAHNPQDALHHNLSLGYNTKNDIEIRPQEPYVMLNGNFYSIKDENELVLCPPESYSLLPYERIRCSPNHQRIFGYLSSENPKDPIKNQTYHAKSFVMGDCMTLRSSASTKFWDILKSHGLEETHLPRIPSMRIFEPASLYPLRE